MAKANHSIRMYEYMLYDMYVYSSIEIPQQYNIRHCQRKSNQNFRRDSIKRKSILSKSTLRVKKIICLKLRTKGMMTSPFKDDPKVFCGSITNVNQSNKTRVSMTNFVLWSFRPENVYVCIRECQLN